MKTCWLDVFFRRVEKKLRCKEASKRCVDKTCCEDVLEGRVAKTYCKVNFSCKEVMHRVFQKLVVKRLETCVESRVAKMYGIVGFQRPCLHSGVRRFYQFFLAFGLCESILCNVFLKFLFLLCEVFVLVMFFFGRVVLAVLCFLSNSCCFQCFTFCLADWDTPCLKVEPSWTVAGSHAGCSPSLLNLRLQARNIPLIQWSSMMFVLLCFPVLGDFGGICSTFWTIDSPKSLLFEVLFSAKKNKSGSGLCSQVGRAWFLVSRI